jgi:hypothetical protein
MKLQIIENPETKELFTAVNDNLVKCQLKSETVFGQSKSGIMTSSSRVAFPTFDKKTALELQKQFNLKNGSTFPIPGKIVRLTSTSPMWEGQKEVSNPTTQESMGYYQNFVFTTNLEDTDRDITEELATVSEEESMLKL